MRENERKNELKLNLERGLFLKLSLLNVMGLSEIKFYELIREVESSPLYKLLSKPEPGVSPAITRKRFLYAWELNLGDKAGEKLTDLRYGFSDLTVGRENLLPLIRKIGRLKFEKYFLDSSAPDSEISRVAGINEESVRQIRNFVNAFLLSRENAVAESVPSEFFSLSAVISGYRNKILIEYSSPFYSSGLYSVNRETLEKMRLSPGFKGREKELNRLMLDINRLNFRKNALDLVLRSLCEYQKEYILKKGSLKPLSMRKFSLAVGLDVSVISRTVSNKYVKLPSGGTLKIKSFFLSRKAFTMGKISDILEKKKKISGRELSVLLMKNAGLRIPVRTVNYYRGLLRKK